MLSSSISTDARVRELPCLGARLLFTWMISHADNLGRMRGEPAYVRATVIPYEPCVTDEDVTHWLVNMDELGLIRWYKVDGGTYIQLSGWEKHQRLDRMKRSDYPPPPTLETTGTRLATAGALKGKGRGSEVEFEVEVEKEGTGRRRGTGKGKPNIPGRFSEDPSHPYPNGDTSHTPNRETASGALYLRDLLVQVEGSACVTMCVPVLFEATLGILTSIPMDSKRVGAERSEQATALLAERHLGHAPQGARHGSGESETFGNAARLHGLQRLARARRGQCEVAAQRRAHDAVRISTPVSSSLTDRLWVRQLEALEGPSSERSRG